MAGINSGYASSPPPRQPEERQEYRKSLHKSSNSPHWKGAYRERCKKRLRESREKFLTRFRNITSERTEEDPAISGSSTESPLASGSGGSARVPSPSSLASSVQEVVMEEWEHVRTEYGNLPSIPQSKRGKLVHTSSQDDLEFLMSEELEADVELVLSIMDELTEELIKEEQALLAQYEDDIRFSEDALCDAVRSLHTDDIICPICQKDYLHQNKQVLFCSCGLRLDTAHDGISLDYIRRQLDHYSLEHSSQCRGKPQFSLETVMQTQTLIMNCPVC
ncbi:RPA-interacting protein A [Geodia barretti]|uniref:RPA-interacting protein A n=1 Tax=Geodia barretti TaxID=519541 RepID=A0AA35T8F5_GEOBA|nr:RPA-interacting protein A [Geodia barretti]